MMLKAIRIPIISFMILSLVGASFSIPSEAIAANGVTLNNHMPWMPTPGTRVGLSPAFIPAHLKGLVVHPDNPLKIDFLIHQGDDKLSDNEKQNEYKKLIKYFLAALAIPGGDQWVNLSPYEKNRIIKEDFGKTEMGRDLLAQDYMLKQITASVIYPEEHLGKKFWDKVYAIAHEKFGSTNVPVNTFNKVWILPDEAEIYEHDNTVYIVKQHLKVMLEEDYVAIKKNSSATSQGISKNTTLETQHLASKHNNTSTPSLAVKKIMQEIIIPELEKEVNQGKNFAALRQIYSGMLLATWYKRALKESLLAKVYANKAKVKGIDQNPKTNQEIYERYLKAFKKGVFNYISTTAGSAVSGKEDANSKTKEALPRKYFSGGAVSVERAIETGSLAMNSVPLSKAKNDWNQLASRVDLVEGNMVEAPSVGRSSQAMVVDLQLIRRARENLGEKYMFFLQQIVLMIHASKESDVAYQKKILNGTYNELETLNPGGVIEIGQDLYHRNKSFDLSGIYDLILKDDGLAQKFKSTTRYLSTINKPESAVDVDTSQRSNNEEGLKQVPLAGLSGDKLEEAKVHNWWVELNANPEHKTHFDFIVSLKSKLLQDEQINVLDLMYALLHFTGYNNGVITIDRFDDFVIAVNRIFKQISGAIQQSTMSSFIKSTELGDWVKLLEGLGLGLTILRSLDHSEYIKNAIKRSPNRSIDLERDTDYRFVTTLKGAEVSNALERVSLAGLSGDKLEGAKVHNWWVDINADPDHGKYFELIKSIALNKEMSIGDLFRTLMHFTGFSGDATAESLQVIQNSIYELIIRLRKVLLSNFYDHPYNEYDNLVKLMTQLEVVYHNLDQSFQLYSKKLTAEGGVSIVKIKAPSSGVSISWGNGADSLKVKPVANRQGELELFEFIAGNKQALFSSLEEIEFNLIQLKFYIFHLKPGDEIDFAREEETGNKVIIAHGRVYSAIDRGNSVYFEPYEKENGRFIPTCRLRNNNGQLEVTNLSHVSPTNIDNNLNPAYTVATGYTKVVAFDSAMTPAITSKLTQNRVNSSTPGGIDLNDANLNLHIKRDGAGVPLSMKQQDLAQLSSIEGFVPEIMSIKSAQEFPLFSSSITSTR